MAEYTICIVNNDPANQETLKGFFAGEGYLAVTACNCKEALALARENRFDAFLIDLEIDSGNGIALCRSIRALEIPKRTPIICFTDQDNPDVLPNAFNAGADDFVAKPINSVSLLARLKLQLKLERARQMLRQYLSPRVASIVEEWSETGKDPEPEERQVAICFTDIRGFTALSETMDPSQLFKSVSGYLRRQVELVYKFRGYIDKFNGDGIMAVFDGGNMVVDACHCALRILQDASRSNPGEGKFPIGIGIHVGRVMMGNIGSQDHLEYSCVGQAVNLAARLCGHADPETIIVSASVRDAVKPTDGLIFVDPREVQIRGVSSPVQIFSLAKKGVFAQGAES